MRTSTCIRCASKLKSHWPSRFRLFILCCSCLALISFAVSAAFNTVFKHGSGTRQHTNMKVDSRWWVAICRRREVTITEAENGRTRAGACGSASAFESVSEWRLASGEIPLRERWETVVEMLPCKPNRVRALGELLQVLAWHRREWILCSPWSARVGCQLPSEVLWSFVGAWRGRRHPRRSRTNSAHVCSIHWCAKAVAE